LEDKRKDQDRYMHVSVQVRNRYNFSTGEKFQPSNPFRACLGISGMNGNEGHWGGGISTISQNFTKSTSILFHPPDSSISQTSPQGVWGGGGKSLSALNKIYGVMDIELSFFFPRAKENETCWTSNAYSTLEF
jgi:hypothetical protein